MPPNQPKTPMHCYRVPDELHEAAKARAAENDEPLSEVVRRALREYIGAEEPDEPAL